MSKEDKKQDEKLYLGHRARLKQRYATAGISAFAPYEVLEMLLMYFIPRKDTKPIAKKLLSKFGNIKNVLNAQKEDLLKIDGIGESVCLALSLIKDISNEYILFEEFAKTKIELDGIDAIAKYLSSIIGPLKYEVVEALFLDSQYFLINKNYRLAQGSLDKVNIDVSTIIKKALKLSAKYIVLAHNHPSGEVCASQCDEAFTNKLSSACKLLDLELLDHIIISSDSFYSFRRASKNDSLAITHFKKSLAF